METETIYFPQERTDNPFTPGDVEYGTHSFHSRKVVTQVKEETITRYP